MSLDVYLKSDTYSIAKGSGIFIRINGRPKEISREEWNRLHPNRPPIMVNPSDEMDNTVFEKNITRNLSKMAREAGLYDCL